MRDCDSFTVASVGSAQLNEAHEEAEVAEVSEERRNCCMWNAFAHLWTECECVRGGRECESESERVVTALQVPECTGNSTICCY